MLKHCRPDILARGHLSLLHWQLDYTAMIPNSVANVAGSTSGRRLTLSNRPGKQLIYLGSYNIPKDHLIGPSIVLSPSPASTRPHSRPLHLGHRKCANNGRAAVAADHPFDFTMAWTISRCCCQQPLPSNLGTAVLVKRLPVLPSWLWPIPESGMSDKSCPNHRGRARPVFL